MNKLVIIGNGFDLAHDLKTKYSHFLLWYINKAIIQLKSLGDYDDPLITLAPIENIRIFSLKSLEEFKHLHTTAKIDFKPKSDFIKKLFDHAIQYNWVDIENQYYSSLIDIYEAIKDGHDIHRLNDLTELNESLDYIKKLLTDYLSTIENILHTDDEIMKHLFLSLDGNSNTRNMNEILFLNFNYTSTIKLYMDYLPNDLKIELNYIHGKLSDNNNPIIFGYGDEMDPYYEKIEHFNNNDFTKHMKSFEYLKTKNYQNFLRFVDSAGFDVYIMGHSCGLSDRILLNSIFEHPNCVRIKIYYYQKTKEQNDFTEKTQEISRHFKPSSKGDMRRKIVPFVDCEPLKMPIFQDETIT